MRSVFTVIFFVLSNLLYAQNVQVKGSDTMLPLLRALSELYLEVGAQSTPINIEGGGSSVGIQALMNNQATMAMSSRDLKPEELTALNAFEKQIIGFDALSIIVNASNPVQKLTKKQLKAIFSGEIKNWREVGGQDLPIQVYTRFATSGTHDFMRTHVMDNANFSAEASAKSSNAGIVQAVSENIAGIGFVGLAYVEDVVKPVSISFEGDYIRPTFKNALDRRYPIARPLYIIYQKEAASAHAFYEFIMSPLGQELVTHKGYIPFKFEP